MNGYFYTMRLGLGGVLLRLAAAVVAAVGMFDLVVASVQPEARVWITKMVAPFAVGMVSVLTIVTALTETFSLRCRTWYR